MLGIEWQLQNEFDGGKSKNSESNTKLMLPNFKRKAAFAESSC